jgi:DNA-binding NtrC family response regulator
MSSPRVLVVDDDPSLRLTLSANLELAGFEVHEAANASEALDLVSRHSFDAILSDIRMPGLDGVEMFQRLREQKPGLPVVLMTAFTDEPHVRSAIDSGVFTILAKPFDVEAALRTLHRAARRPVVVIVDDLEIFATTTAIALGDIGVRAVAVFDVEAALRVVRDDTVDVCITDLAMPGQDGIELIARLREHDPAIAVIAVSGAARSDELMRRAVGLGAIRCLRKPIDPLALARSIASARGGG